MELNLHQAVKLVSQLRTELNEETEKISDRFTVPLTVNGKSAVTEEKEAEALKVYERIGKLTEDLIAIRREISRANNENGLDDLNIHIQETRKLIKSLKYKIQTANMYGGSSDVVSGVGVVEKGIVNLPMLEAYVKSLEYQVDNVQDKLDEKNSKINIELEFKTR